MKICVTGGAGFIGSNFVQHLLDTYPDYRVVVVDKLTYAGNLRNLERVLADPRLSFVRLDVCDPAVAEAVEGCDAVVHLAAESHVDRSIEDAAAFLRSNVEGTWRMLDACRRARVPRYLQVSTDEVYGSLGPEGKFVEASPLAPNSPYSATKAAGDLLVLSYVHTHGFPAIVTRCSNNYGPYQFPEKFIPLMVAQAMAGEFLPVYGDGQNVRDWIHVSDHCRALDVLLHRGREGEVYNIGGGCEIKNLELATRILALLGRPSTLIKMVQDRPGHDRRYAIDSTKLTQELGWTPQWDFSRGLESTIQWYRNHSDWLQEIRSGQYMAYFERHYLQRETTFAVGNR